MTTRTSDRFDLAHESRKAILTHLLKHGRCNTNQVADALSIGVDAAGRMMRAMVDIGELEKHGSGKNITYSACSTETLSADCMRRAMLKAKDAGRAREREKDANRAAMKSTKGRYVHTMGYFPADTGHEQGHPLKNQDAQGSGRGRVFVGGTWGMV